MNTPPLLIHAVLATWDGDGCALLCPSCGTTQVQPLDVLCHPAGPDGGVAMIDAEGIHLDRTFQSERDVFVVVRLRCDRHEDDGDVDVGRIQVDLQVPPWITLQVAPHLLVPALTNIIKNAYEALTQAPTDGAPALISIIANADDAWVDLQISDNGMGFAPEEAAALKPFTPGRRNKTKRNSTGYGLPNAMRNIAAHGGTVQIQSEMNRGTTVFVRLPLRDVDAPALGETP